MPQSNGLDRTVGKIAGAIYSDIASRFPQPPLVLLPGLTLKVRKRMEQVTDLNLFSREQKIELAKDIQTSIIPLLYSLELDPDIITQIIPMIESAAMKALVQPA